MKLLLIFVVLLTLKISISDSLSIRDRLVIKINQFLITRFEKTLKVNDPNYSSQKVLSSPLFQLSWFIYKTTNGKKYDSKDDLRHREIFLSNIEEIVKHNYKYLHGSSIFSVDINQFSDVISDVKIIDEVKINEFLTNIFEKILSNPNYSREEVLNSEQFKKLWFLYKYANGKEYNESNEDLKRQEIFLNNVEEIVLQNNDDYQENGVTLYINQYTDMTWDEVTPNERIIDLTNDEMIFDEITTVEITSEANAFNEYLTKNFKNILNISDSNYSRQKF